MSVSVVSWLIFSIWFPLIVFELQLRIVDLKIQLSYPISLFFSTSPCRFSMLNDVFEKYVIVNWYSLGILFSYSYISIYNSFLFNSNINSKTIFFIFLIFQFIIFLDPKDKVILVKLSLYLFLFFNLYSVFL